MYPRATVPDNNLDDGPALLPSLELALTRRAIDTSRLETRKWPGKQFGRYEITDSHGKSVRGGPNGIDFTVERSSKAN